MAGEPTFAPSVNPAFDIEDNRQPRLKKTEFGDGYTQRSRDGLNHDAKAVDLTWKNISVAEGEPIFAFFEARGGDEAFFYDVPFIGLVKWTAEAYKRNFTDPDTMSIAVSLKECFDP